MPISANPNQKHDNEIAVVRFLMKRKWTLATAESCTGGLIANQITNVPGASKIFLGGIIAYSNDVKEKFLGVRSSSLKKFGAVSENVAREMAEETRKKFDSDFAIATTGIAGPTGGTKSKPVGTVFIAAANKGKTVVVHKFNPFSRKKFKEVTTQQALQLLLLMMTKGNLLCS